MKASFWHAHQQLFHSLCIDLKVDKAIEIVKQAVKDGHCCIIDIQSTGEAAAKRDNANNGGSEEATKENLKRISE